MRVEPKTARLEGVPFIAAADHGGSLVVPRFVILHYTAGSSFGGAKNVLTARDENYVSAHIMIGRDGTIAQLVRLDEIAYHAGESAWKGYRRLNSCSIGIELVNPGYVRAGFPAWPSKPAFHKNGGPKRLWYTYPEEQISALCDVLRALYSAYGGLSEAIGHDDVAPARKLDPGPSFPWAEIPQPARRA